MTRKLYGALFLFALLSSQANARLPKAISFDGYCDGISHIATDPSGVVTGFWDLSHCPQDLGRFRATLLRGRHLNEMGQTGTYDTATNPGLLPPSTVIRINDNGRFTYYDSRGHWLTSGTWSPLPKARRGDGLSVRR